MIIDRMWLTTRDSGRLARDVVRAPGSVRFDVRQHVPGLVCCFGRRAGLGGEEDCGGAIGDKGKKGPFPSSPSSSSLSSLH